MPETRLTRRRLIDCIAAAIREHDRSAPMIAAKIMDEWCGHIVPQPPSTEAQKREAVYEAACADLDAGMSYRDVATKHRIPLGSLGWIAARREVVGV